MANPFSHPLCRQQGQSRTEQAQDPKEWPLSQHPSWRPGRMTQVLQVGKMANPFSHPLRRQQGQSRTEQVQEKAVLAQEKAPSSRRCRDMKTLSA